MRGCRLSDGYAKLYFKYFDKNPHVTINDLTKTVKKAKSKVYRVISYQTLRLSDISYSQKRENFRQP